MEAPNTKPRKYCCCFSSKRSLGICALVTFLILVGISLTLYFLFPRVPSATFGPANDKSSYFDSLQATTKEANLTLGVLRAGPSNPLVVVLTLSFSLSVYSPNYIDIYANAITSQLNLVNNDGSLVPNIQGTNQLKDVNFKRLANTTVTSNAYLTYNLTTPINQLSSDPTIVFLVNNCVKAQNMVKLRYSTELDFRILAWTGIKPVISGDVSTECKVNSDVIMNASKSEL